MSDIDDLLRMVGLRNRAERPYNPLANSSSEDDAVGTANDTTQESRNAVEELFDDPALPEGLENVASEPAHNNNIEELSQNDSDMLNDIFGDLLERPEEVVEDEQSDVDASLADVATNQTVDLNSFLRNDYQVSPLRTGTLTASEIIRSRQGILETLHTLEEQATNTAAVSTVSEEQTNRNRGRRRSSSQEGAIPQNSDSLLIDQRTSRFAGASWYEAVQKSKIILAGLGGIGSWTAMQLARMSPAVIALYDDDIVEAGNMSGQLYSINDVGKNKVDAMHDMISQYTTAKTVFALPERFTENTEAGDIMICGFDNMAARKLFFTKWKEHVDLLPEERKKDCLYIDGRLSMDTLQVFCIKGDDTYSINKYSTDYLFDDSQADATVCSMKQTTYLACMIGSVITNLFTNFIANSLDPVIPYDLPFFTEYDAQNVIFKTKN